MSDDRLRNTQRQADSGDIEAKARLLNARLRRGDLLPDNIYVAMLMGDKASYLLLENSVPASYPANTVPEMATKHQLLKRDTQEILFSGCLFMINNHLANYFYALHDELQQDTILDYEEYQGPVVAGEYWTQALLQTLQLANNLTLQNTTRFSHNQNLIDAAWGQVGFGYRRNGRHTIDQLMLHQQILTLVCNFLLA